MAVYNGEKYLIEQIDSILNMMGKFDELIISYDISNDNTMKILNSYKTIDNRIKIFLNTEKGLESNFNNAIYHCSGKYIFLSDQDDIWINNKINRIINKFEEDNNIVVLISDGYEVDCNLNIINTLFERYKTTVNPLINLIKDKLLLHRLHDNNYSNNSKMNIKQMIDERLLFVRELFANWSSNYGRMF